MVDKKAVVTLAVGDRHKSIFAECMPLMKHYAKRIGAQLIISTTKDDSMKVPHYRKFTLINEALEKYDRVAWIDCDILISKLAPSIFEEVPKGKFGIFNEALWTDRKEACEQWGQMTGFKFPDHTYYNTGVMVCDKSHKDIFKMPDTLIHHFGEQTYLNQRIIESKCEIHPLSHHWNRMSCTHMQLGEEPFCSHFIHFAGETSENLPMFIRQTASYWENQKQWKGIKSIVVVGNNGMGNQIATLPVVEYLAELHPEYEIYVQTHFPEVFEHLVERGIKTLKTGEAPPSKFAIWRSTAAVGMMQDVCTHPTDFHSLSLIMRQLPLKKKRIKFPPKDCGKKLPPNTVVIHAGKSGWKSKEAPREFWQEIITGLKAKGFPIALIGQRDWGKVKEGYGAQYFNECEFDFTDRSLSETADVISRGWMLLTNDSMPVHLAGAYDRYIGLITIAKRPELILPFRHGMQNFKTLVWTGTPLWEVAKEPLVMAPGTGFNWGQMHDGMKWPNAHEIVNTIANLMFQGPVYKDISMTTDL